MGRSIYHAKAKTMPGFDPFDKLVAAMISCDASTFTSGSL